MTQADTAIEERIRERLLGGLPRPRAGRRGVRHGAGDASERWYIDPIDGTHNYMRGVPLFGTLLARRARRRAQAGVMCAPALDSAGGPGAAAGPGRATGARPRAGSRCRGVDRLEDAQLLYASGARSPGRAGCPGFGALLDDVWRERGFGDFWGYALVAEGAAEAMVEVGLKPGTWRRRSVVVEEAGGLATDLDGRRAVDPGRSSRRTASSTTTIRGRLLER